MDEPTLQPGHGDLSPTDQKRAVDLASRLEQAAGRLIGALHGGGTDARAAAWQELAGAARELGAILGEPATAGIHGTEPAPAVGATPGADMAREEMVVGGTDVPGGGEG